MASYVLVNNVDFVYTTMEGSVTVNKASRVVQEYVLFLKAHTSENMKGISTSWTEKNFSMSVNTTAENCVY